MLKIRIILQLFKAFFRPRFINRQVLTQYQQERLAKHLAWVKSHSPFYKKLQNVDFQQLPIFDKSKMIENFDDLNTQNIKKETALRIATAAENSRNFQETLPEGITVGLSSGTSGNKGIFLATESERAQWVAEILQRVLPIRLGKKQKIAFFLRSNSTLYQSIKSNFFDFHFFDLAKPFPILIEQVFDFQPDILIAPPSALLEIAQKMEQDNLSFCPKKVVSVAEVLEKDIQKRLETIFKQKIHQVYQATEGFLGSTCTHGTLHLHEDLIYFEKKYIDDAQTAFYPIISDFNRRTQPMLRYELNDILHERQTPCPCGSVLLAIDHIEGRSDDILDFNGIKIFPDFFRYAVLLASDDVLNFQITQKANNQLLVKLKISNTDFEKVSILVKNRIENLLKERGVTYYNIQIEPLKHDDFFNKFRRVVKSL